MDLVRLSAVLLGLVLCNIWDFVVRSRPCAMFLWLWVEMLMIDVAVKFSAEHFVSCNLLYMWHTISNLSGLM